jgi:hypothetical protein
MSQEEIDADVDDLINQAEEEKKQKEEKILNKKTNKSLSKINVDDEDLENGLKQKLITKTDTVVNKNIKRSDSFSSSDSDSSPQDISDDEKNDDLKRNKNKTNIKKFKSSMASNDSSLENLMVREDLSIKILTLISCVICISTIGLNIIVSLLNGKLTLTFGYGQSEKETDDLSDLSDIVMNRTMIYILLIVLICFNLGLFIVVLLGNDHMLTKLIYTDLNWYFVFTQFALGFQFLITLIWDIDLWTINVCLSVSMLAILILAFYFTEIKQKKNMSIYTFVFIYIYVSILLSFIAYITLFNISCILMENVGYDDEDARKTLMRVIKVVINASQSVLSFVLLTYYKDIFFSFSSAYIESAVFIHLDTKFEDENIALLVFVVVIVFGIIITLYKYRKKTFGFEEVPGEIIKDFN